MHRITFALAIAESVYSENLSTKLQLELNTLSQFVDAAQLVFDDGGDLPPEGGYIVAFYVTIEASNMVSFVGVLEKMLLALLPNSKHGELCLSDIGVEGEGTTEIYMDAVGRLMGEDPYHLLSRLLLWPVVETADLILHVEKNWTELHKHILIADRKKIHAIYKDAVDDLMDDLSLVYGVSEIKYEKGRCYKPVWMPDIHPKSIFYALTEDEVDDDVKCTFFMLSSPLMSAGSFEDIETVACSLMNKCMAKICVELDRAGFPDLYDEGVVSFAYFAPNEFMLSEGKMPECVA